VPANNGRRDRRGRWLSLGQVLDFQEIMHEMALGWRSDLSGSSDREERARLAAALSNLGKSFGSLQAAKREILGKPKAGVLKPENLQTKRNRMSVTGPIECGVPQASAGGAFQA